MSHGTTSWTLAAAALAIAAALPAAALASAGAGDPGVATASVPSDAASGELSQSPSRMTASRFLSQLSDAQRAGAVLQLELSATARSTYGLQSRQVESDWAAGRYSTAISAVRSLESSGVRVNVALGWPHAQPTAAPTLGSNVRITANVLGEPATDTAIDYDQATGNLLALARASSNWAVYLSTNAGASWAQTASWCCNPGVTDLSVVGGFGYVAYDSSVDQELRMRRVFGSTGAMDNSYGFVPILNTVPNSVVEVATASNADDFDNRIYTLALVGGGGGLHWFWADASTASTFNEDSPSAPLVSGGISQSWVSDWDGTHDYIFLSYRASDNSIRVHGQNPSGVWDSGSAVATGAAGYAVSSISAWNNVAIVGFDGSAQNLLYRISYNNGSTWASGALFDPTTEGGAYYVPLVSARSGTGTAAIGGDELGSFDEIRFKQRTRFVGGGWQAAAPVNDQDFVTGSTSTDFEWMGHGWGVTYLDNAGAPWFTWSPAIFYSGFERGNTSAWSSTLSP